MSRDELYRFNLSLDCFLFHGFNLFFNETLHRAAKLHRDGLRFLLFIIVCRSMMHVLLKSDIK